MNFHERKKKQQQLKCKLVWKQEPFIWKNISLHLAIEIIKNPLNPIKPETWNLQNVRNRGPFAKLENRARKPIRNPSNLHNRQNLPLRSQNPIQTLEHWYRFRGFVEPSNLSTNPNLGNLLEPVPGTSEPGNLSKTSKHWYRFLEPRNLGTYPKPWQPIGTASWNQGTWEPIQTFEPIGNRFLEPRKPGNLSKPCNLLETASLEPRNLGTYPKPSNLLEPVSWNQGNLGNLSKTLEPIGTGSWNQATCETYPNLGTLIPVRGNQGNLSTNPNLGNLLEPTPGTSEPGKPIQTSKHWYRFLEPRNLGTYPNLENLLEPVPGTKEPGKPIQTLQPIGNWFLEPRKPGKPIQTLEPIGTGSRNLGTPGTYPKPTRNLRTYANLGTLIPVRGTKQPFNKSKPWNLLETRFPEPRNPGNLSKPPNIDTGSWNQGTWEPIQTLKPIGNRFLETKETGTYPNLATYWNWFLEPRNLGTYPNLGTYWNRFLEPRNLRTYPNLGTLIPVSWNQATFQPIQNLGNLLETDSRKPRNPGTYPNLQTLIPVSWNPCNLLEPVPGTKEPGKPIQNLGMYWKPVPGTSEPGKPIQTNKETCEPIQTLEHWYRFVEPSNLSNQSKTLEPIGTGSRNLGTREPIQNLQTLIPVSWNQGTWEPTPTSLWHEVTQDPPDFGGPPIDSP